MMSRGYFLVLLLIPAFFSCGKDTARGGDTYIVSARKIINIKAGNWGNAEQDLKNKRDYQYIPSAANLSHIIKAEVHLPAVDDSNRTVNGRILLNIAPNNSISYAGFDTDIVDQQIAYAMMLNYNHETLQTLTGIIFSIGEILDNGAGGNPPVNTVLEKLNSGQAVDKLAITYHAAQGRFTMVVFRQNNGRYLFSFRGSQ